MYQKYHTEAIILRGANVGEADRFVMAYSQDFGLIGVRASAARREASKMRYALQNYDYSQLSLIKGNRGWRAAGAALIARIPSENMSGGAALARIASLIERLVGGEDPNAYLFSVLADAHRAFSTEDPQSHPAIELACVARILFTLGYLSPEALGNDFFASSSYDTTLLQRVHEARSGLLQSVNRAIAATHL